MGKEAKETEGGLWIKANTDKRGGEHIDIYDDDPKGPHDESIHITFKTDDTITVTTKSGDEPRETTDLKCFLTTTCIRNMKDNFDDDCYELTVLRWFRDNFVATEDIKYYYEIAPLIVECINKSPDSNEVYKNIYERIILVCVNAIENKNYAFAYSTYKNAILDLETEYVRPALTGRLIRVLKMQTK